MKEPILIQDTPRRGNAVWTPGNANASLEGCLEAGLPIPKGTRCSMGFAGKGVTVQSSAGKFFFDRGCVIDLQEVSGEGLAFYRFEGPQAPSFPQAEKDGFYLVIAYWKEQTQNYLVFRLEEQQDREKVRELIQWQKQNWNKQNHAKQRTARYIRIGIGAYLAIAGGIIITIPLSEWIKGEKLTLSDLGASAVIAGIFVMGLILIFKKDFSDVQEWRAKRKWQKEPLQSAEISRQAGEDRGPEQQKQSAAQTKPEAMDFWLEYGLPLARGAVCTLSFDGGYALGIQSGGAVLSLDYSRITDMSVRDLGSSGVYLTVTYLDGTGQRLDSILFRMTAPVQRFELEQMIEEKRRLMAKGIQIKL